MNTASEPGGPAESGWIPLSVPLVGGNAWAYVKECLDSGWVSSAGEFVTRFEHEVARRAGRPHGVACTSGTAALHLGLLVAGVQPGDEVIVPALTFAAPANAVRYLGAWPVFVDIEPDYWQLDPQRVRDFVERACDWRDGALVNKTTGRRVRAVLPVDLLGHPVDIDALLEVARSRELPVIEDATETLGARYRGAPVGAAADIACFSFNGNKVVTAGGGGVLVTDRKEWAARAKHLSTQAKVDPVEYVHDEIGFNYRLTNIQAALGVSQLELLDEYVTAKRRIAERYSEAFAAVPGIHTMHEAPWAESTFWLYTPLIDAAAYGADSRALMRHLTSLHIQSRPLWQPLHRSPAHAGSPAADAPIADRIAAAALSLPSSVGLTTADQDRVIHAVVARGR
ncbi:MAG TPA: LegC family aminotransferase [Vicinamibacterales bacterium]|nr:LegC family aminotransferase [Vicinamibacterales bacterium]